MCLCASVLIIWGKGKGERELANEQICELANEKNVRRYSFEVR